MKEPPRRLLLEPDWPRLRQPVAKRLGTMEAEVDRVKETGDSLDQVERVMATEEVLERFIGKLTLAGKGN